MRAAACVASLWLCAAPLAAQQPAKSAARTGKVERGDFRVLVRVQGTVATEDVFRLKSTIEGRIEAIQTSSFTWAKANESLGFLSHRELAALMDARATTSREVLEERWQRVYQPTPIRCPVECYVLKVFARPKLWVQPETVLVEAAAKLRLIGRVRPGDSHWVKDGQIVWYWDKRNPKRKQQARVEKFILDTQGDKVDPGGTFSALLSSSHYLPPGTEWQGLIIAHVEKNALSVPTSALVFHEGEVFLPVRVSTGITTYDMTQIEAGAREGDKILLLDPARLAPSQRYQPAPVVPGAGKRSPAITEEDILDYMRRAPKTTPLTKPAVVPFVDEEFPSDLEDY